MNLVQLALLGFSVIIKGELQFGPRDAVLQSKVEVGGGRCHNGGLVELELRRRCIAARNTLNQREVGQIEARNNLEFELITVFLFAQLLLA